MKYYLYTPEDGNEDGLLSPYSLVEAKEAAIRAAARLTSEGCSNCSVQVIDTETGEVVWSR